MVRFVMWSISGTARLMRRKNASSRRLIDKVCKAQRPPCMSRRPTPQIAKGFRVPAGGGQSPADASPNWRRAGESRLGWRR